MYFYIKSTFYSGTPKLFNSLKNMFENVDEHLHHGMASSRAVMLIIQLYKSYLSNAVDYSIANNMNKCFNNWKHNSLIYKISAKDIDQIERMIINSPMFKLYNTDMDYHKDISRSLVASGNVNRDVLNILRINKLHKLSKNYVSTNLYFSHIDTSSDRLDINIFEIRPIISKKWIRKEVKRLKDEDGK